jgi:hypothetical protein
MYEYSDYLREQVAKYLELAKKQENSLRKQEFLQLAEICEEVANDMDDRRVSGWQRFPAVGHRFLPVPQEASGYPPQNYPAWAVKDLLGSCSLPNAALDAL